MAHLRSFQKKEKCEGERTGTKGTNLKWVTRKRGTSLHKCDKGDYALSEAPENTPLKISTIIAGSRRRPKREGNPGRKYNELQRKTNGSVGAKKFPKGEDKVVSGNSTGK